MTKWSYKSSSHLGRNNAGCMWGLFSMLDFRQGSFKKLLPDRKQGSGRQSGHESSRSTVQSFSNFQEKQEDADYVDDKIATEVNLGMTTVKALMEKEMSREQPLANTSRSSVQVRSSEKKDKKGGTKVDSDFQKSIWKISDTLEDQLARSCVLDLASVILDSCVDNHQWNERHVDCKTKSDSCPPSENVCNRQLNHLCERIRLLAQGDSILQKALVEVAKAITRENSHGTNQLAGKEEAYVTGELIAALNMVRSKKDLFLKVLDSSSSCVSKCGENHQNAQDNRFCGLGCGEDIRGKELMERTDILGQYSEPDRVEQFGGLYNAFRNADESQGTKASKGNNSCQSLLSIVVLRPIFACNHPGDTGKTSCRRASQSSALESCERKPNLNGSESEFECQFAPPKAASWKPFNKKAVAYSHDGGSSLYKAANKYLEELLKTGDDDDISPNNQVFETMAGLLCQPDCKSLFSSFHPERNKEPVFVPYEISYVHQLKQEHSTNNHLNLLEQTLDGSSCDARSAIPIRQMLGENLVLLDGCCSDEINVKDFSGRMVFGEEDEYYDVAMQLNTDRSDDTKGRCEEEGSSILAGLGSLEEAAQPSQPSVSVLRSSLPIQIGIPAREVPIGIELPAREGSTNREKAERLSPVSVFEPLFSDVIISPAATEDTHVVQFQHIQLEEHDSCSVLLALLYSEANLRSEGLQAYLISVRKLLEASGLTCDKSQEGGPSSEWLLDPSLFLEAEISSCPIPNDPKLLSDCTNEVLVEIQERLFGCLPWISLVKPDVRPIPKGRNFIEEVCKRVDSYLHPHFPTTIHELVGRDINAGSWTDLCIETESTIIEVGDLILADLIEETACKIWV